jgi:hypothetical protein
MSKTSANPGLKKRKAGEVLVTVKLLRGLIAVALTAVGGGGEDTQYSYSQTARCLQAEHRFEKIATSDAADVTKVTYRRFRPRDVVDVAIYFDGPLERKRIVAGSRRLRIRNVTLVWRQPPEQWARDRIVDCLS